MIILTIRMIILIIRPIRMIILIILGLSEACCNCAQRPFRKFQKFPAESLDNEEFENKNMSRP